MRLASNNMQYCKDIFIKRVEEYGDLLDCASVRLRSYEKLVLGAVKKTDVFYYMRLKLKNYWEVLQEALAKSVERFELNLR